VETHPSFLAFMRLSVLPRHLQNPNDVRLDGEPTESAGTRKAFGLFHHNGREWKVDADTRYAPLLLAYAATLAGNDPFVESTTTTGKGVKLSLSGSLQQVQHSRSKYLYVYLNE
jgi:hypothetical protein